jgi:hypothetical protein
MSEVCKVIPTRLIATSREVAQAIHAAHNDLQKWSGWTLPGDVMAEWALPGADAPLLRQRTTFEWARDPSVGDARARRPHAPASAVHVPAPTAGSPLKSHAGSVETSKPQTVPQAMSTPLFDLESALETAVQDAVACLVEAVKPGTPTDRVKVELAKWMVEDRSQWRIGIAEHAAATGQTPADPPWLNSPQSSSWWVNDATLARSRLQPSGRHSQSRSLQARRPGWCPKLCKQVPP